MGADSLDMEDSEERMIPYITNAMCLLLAYYMMKKLQAPNMVCLMMLGAVAAVVVGVIVNLRWKIIIHLIGSGGTDGTVFSDCRLFSSSTSICRSCYPYWRQACWEQRDSR
jgi:hypothetical protein